MNEERTLEKTLSRDIWRKAFTVIAKDDHRKTAFTLFVVIPGALTAALMVASILPFLTVLSKPDAIAQNAGLAWFARTLGLSAPYAVLVGVGVASITLIVLGSALQNWKTYMMERSAARQSFTIAQRLLRIYLDKPYAYFFDRHSSDMATIILSEAGDAVGYFIRPAIELIAAALTLLAITALMLWVAPGMTLGVLAVVGGAFALTSLITRRYALRFGRMRAKANAERYKIVNEGFGGIKEIKVMGLEHRYQRRYDPPALKIVQALIGMRFIAQMPRHVIHALVSGGVILLCLVLVPSETTPPTPGWPGWCPRWACLPWPHSG